MSIVQIRHVQAKLKDLYSTKIDTSDSIVSNKEDVF